MMMMRSRKKDYIIYDVIEKKEITLKSGRVIYTSNQLGFDYTALSKLTNKTNISNRYILPTARGLIFTLIDIESNIEYDCITNKTIFIHLNKPYSENDAKYVYELRKRRQGRATICGRLFSLKGGHESKITSKVKVLPQSLKDKLEEKRENAKIKRAIYCRMRRAINDFGKNRYKSGKTQDLLGCSMESFRKYIQSKFTKNMNWDNRRLWDIDHIIPCAAFDLSTDFGQKECFHYTNLQPIWRTTKIAEKMGETNYVGNQNKNVTGGRYDYFLVETILNHNYKMKLSKNQAINFATELLKRGIKKILP